MLRDQAAVVARHAVRDSLAKASALNVDSFDDDDCDDGFYGDADPSSNLRKAKCCALCAVEKRGKMNLRKHGN
jgi:hypothetical protein